MENAISEKQLEANRANAQKSTGPRTEAGKKRSALNALRHGLTAQVTIMTDADRAALEAFSLPIIADLAPVGAMETQLAQTIATFQFRINRIAAIEQNLFSLGDIEDLAGELDLENPEIHTAACQTKAFAKDPAAFDRLSMYSQRLSSQCDRAMKQLERRQSERKDQRNWEMNRAVELHKYFKMTNQEFDPRQFGFVCTPDEVRRKIRRDALDREAKLAGDCGFNPEEFAKKFGEKAA